MNRFEQSRRPVFPPHEFPPLWMPSCCLLTTSGGCFPPFRVSGGDLALQTVPTTTSPARVALPEALQKHAAAHLLV